MKYYKGRSEIEKPFYYKWHCAEYGNAFVNTMQFHIHQSAEIMLVTKGEIEITVVNNKTETVRAGQAALMLPFRPHKYVTKNGTEYLRCNFEQSILPDFFALCAGKDCESFVFDVKSITCSHLTDQLTENGKKISAWNMKSFLYSVVDDFLSSVTLLDSEIDDHILTSAIKYMESHKRSDINIADVASHIGYSKSHLSYCINKTIGINFATLLSMLRIENARYLLKNTDESVLDIALECGFGSVRSFYRQFKSITGFSPKDYRKPLESKDNNDSLAYNDPPMKIEVSL